MEKKEIEFSVKTLSEEGTFSGILSTYDTVDLGGDQVMRGAFTKTLRENGGKVPLLGFHDTRVWNLGVLNLRDSHSGLEVEKASLNLDLAAAREAHAAMKFNAANGLRTGLSIGYKIIKDDHEGGVHRLKELKLYEGSLCTFAMNPDCRVTAVKADENIDPDALFLSFVNSFRKDEGKLPFATVEQARLHIAITKAFSSRKPSAR